ncbi:MAG: hypothetical protein Q8920_02615 [Bacillota bacterium]|nr:hypothetical protein [Bacillota bacterium]
MGKILNFKDIYSWQELFDMTFDYLTFLLEEDKIKPELVIKTTYDILNNAGYGYELETVRKEYYNHD